MEAYLQGKEPAILGVRCHVTRKGKRTRRRMGDAIDIELDGQLGRKRDEEGGCKLSLYYST